MRQRLIESPELFKKLNDEVRAKLGMNGVVAEVKPEEKPAPKEKKPAK